MLNSEKYFIFVAAGGGEIEGEADTAGTQGIWRTTAPFGHLLIFE
jgi:hypothetical protein